MEVLNNLESQYALQVAFQTMKERCQLLQERLITVEEENAMLRQKYEKSNSMTMINIDKGDENNIVSNPEEKIKQLQRRKSLASHIDMVSSENRVLWKRLTKLTRVNKSLGNQLTKISDTLKQHPPTEIPPALTYSFKEIPEFLQDNKNDIYNVPNNDEKEHSLEEISLQWINGMMLKKSELEQHCAEMDELQTNTEMSFKNIGFTYPEDINSDSSDPSKYHDTKLTFMKELLLNQQNKLVNILQNMKKWKTSRTCNNCKNNIEKLMCQAETQFDSDNSIKENGATQTSLSTTNLMSEKTQNADEFICPLCGIAYKKPFSFDLFHEHVINHFTNVEEKNKSDDMDNKIDFK